MIYLKGITEEQNVLVPRNYRTGEYDGYSLVMQSTVDLQETILPLSDVKPAGDYIDCVLTLPRQMATGEYQYTLKGDMEELSTGLAVVTWEDEAPKEYRRLIQYEQYGER